MTFEENFEQYLRRVERIRDQLDELSEEATKNALVMPFFAMLGYDVFDTSEFMPEYTCDVAAKKGEKIDYAILKDGEPTMLIECKRAGMKLQKQQQAQLFRYFSTNRCRIAILTNGLTYQFFSDLNAPNVMDEDPFLSFNLLEDDPAIYRAAVRQFTKEKFDVKYVISKAVFQKYSKVVEKAMMEDLENPSDALVKYFLSRPEVVTGSRITAQMIERYREVTKIALQKVFKMTSCNEERMGEITAVKKPGKVEAPMQCEQAPVQLEVDQVKEEPDPVVEPTDPKEQYFTSAQDICDYIMQRFDTTTSCTSCAQEDTPDYMRIHIYAEDRKKLATLKIEKSDLSMQLRKFENGIPVSYPVQSVEDFFDIMKSK